MSARNDGGPAYPISNGRETDFGMSLRDYFAGQVVSTIMPDARVEDYAHAATEAYKMADAMLAAREATS